MGVAWQVGAAIAAAILIVGAASLWWWMPQWQMRSVTAADPKARADIEDNFRKTLGQLLGGVAAALIASGFAYLQSLQQQRATEEQRRASEAQLNSDQVVKGFELLGSEKRLLRISGIYTLETVMNYSGRYYQPVLATLCGFVRDSTSDRRSDGEPAIDIQAALTVIGKRRQGFGEVDLAGVNVSRADLRAADLRNASLNGAVLVSANLSSANLYGADLDHANLSSASLGRADLIRAYLHGANLEGVDLSGAKLKDARLDGQAQLDKACGVPESLPLGLTLNKPCPAKSAASELNPR